MASGRLLGVFDADRRVVIEECGRGRDDDEDGHQAGENDPMKVSFFPS